MSQKTSTAALDSFGERRLANRRRAPRHPAGGRRDNEVRKQRSNKMATEFGQAQIVVGYGGNMTGRRANGMAGRIRVILPVILRITFSLVLWTLGAAIMTFSENQTRGGHRATHAVSVRPSVPPTDKTQQLISDPPGGPDQAARHPEEGNNEVKEIMKQRKENSVRRKG